MRALRSLAKYLAFARIAAARARRARADLFARAAFFIVILGVFSSLWRAAAEAGGAAPANPSALVWYLAVTEWILLSAPLVHVDVQEAIRRGDVAYQLGRPVSYVGAALAEGWGLLAARAPVLGLTAFGCAFVFSGTIPPFRALALVVPFGLAASALLTALYLALGLLAFWLEDVTPVFWVMQKLLFVFGGLMLPIQMYPAALQRMAGYTPFPSVLGRPATLVANGADAAALALDLAMWSLVIALTLRWTFRRAVLRMTMNGG